MNELIGGYESRETRNWELYSRVLKARQERGIIEKYKSTDPVDHSLLHSYILDLRNGKHYRVEKVLKHWYWGWYYAVLLESNGSHVLRSWENISSVQESVLEQIGMNRKNLQEIPLRTEMPHEHL